MSRKFHVLVFMLVVAGAGCSAPAAPAASPETPSSGPASTTVSTNALYATAVAIPVVPSVPRPNVEATISAAVHATLTSIPPIPTGAPRIATMISQMATPSTDNSTNGYFDARIAIIEASAQNDRDFIKIMDDWNASVPTLAMRNRALGNMDLLLVKMDANVVQSRELQIPTQLSGLFRPMAAACQNSLDLDVQAFHAVRNGWATFPVTSTVHAAITQISDAAIQAQLACSKELDKLKR